METHSRVAVPEIHKDVRQRLAGLGVDELDIHVQRNALLALDNVLANQFTRDVYTELADTQQIISEPCVPYNTVPGSHPAPGYRSPQIRTNHGDR